MTEQPAIAAALRRSLLEMLPKNSIGAEIGVHKGDFSAVILTTLEPARLHLIDPWHYEASPTYEGAWYGGQAEGGQKEMDARYESVVERFADEIRSGAVVVHRGESAAVLEQFPTTTSTGCTSTAITSMSSCARISNGRCARRRSADWSPVTTTARAAGGTAA